jgi:hypothetical protein
VTPCDPVPSWYYDPPDDYTGDVGPEDLPDAWDDPPEWDGPPDYGVIDDSDFP